MATKALSYLISVHVEPEGEQVLVVSTKHDHARHRREFTSMWTALDQAVAADDGDIRLSGPACREEAFPCKHA